MPPPPLLLAAAKLAMMAPGLAVAGRAAQRARLPLVTGYAVAGAALGPACARLLTRADLAALASLDAAALACVALAAGAELRGGDLRRVGRQLIALTLSIFLASAAAVAGALVAVPSAARALAGGVEAAVPGAIALAAVIAGARSPAAAAAVLRELGGSGPYCTLLMSVVVAKDALVFAAFAAVAEAVAASPAGGGAAHAHAPSPASLVARPLGALVVSACVGVTGGVVLASALARWPPPADDRPAGRRSRVAAALRSALPRAADGGVRAALTAVAAAATAAGAARGGGEPLLAAVAAGAVATNWGGGAAAGAQKASSGGAATTSAGTPSPSRGGGAGDRGEPAHAARLEAALAALSPGVNLIFFSLAGASLRLGALPRTLPSALVIAAARAGGVVLGSAAGAAAARVPDAIATRVWQGMITQAGVALGLARAVDRRFPEWGADFGATMASVIIVNLLAGPPLFRAAVVGVGEARALDAIDGPSSLTSPSRPARPGSGPSSPAEARPRSPRGGAGAPSPARRSEPHSVV